MATDTLSLQDVVFDILHETRRTFPATGTDLNISMEGIGVQQGQWAKSDVSVLRMHSSSVGDFRLWLECVGFGTLVGCVAGGARCRDRHRDFARLFWLGLQGTPPRLLPLERNWASRLDSAQTSSSSHGMPEFGGFEIMQLNVVGCRRLEKVVWNEPLFHQENRKKPAFENFLKIRRNE